MLSAGKNLLSALAVFVLAPCCLSAAEFFADDFENYFSDVELEEVGGWQRKDVNNPIENAIWSVMNPGGRRPPPTANGTPSTGVFLISDSDWAQNENPTGSGMSHDIWSPSFSCEGAQRVWLHFDCSAQLNNNGRAVFDVDVSLDLGESWENVFRRVAPQRLVEPVVTMQNADGVFGRLDIDITDLAVGQADVMFRLRHFEPNDDWWIAVDNVVVDDVAAPRGLVAVLAKQTFTEGIPEDWTATSNIGGEKLWSTADACAPPRSLFNQNGGVFPDPYDGRSLHHFEESFAIVDSNCAHLEQDELLITPVIDCSDCTEVFLHVKSAIVADISSIQEILVSLNGGETFETPALFSYLPESLFDEGEDPFYNEFTFAVPEAARKSAIAFAFHYQAFGNRWWWAIDDVEVTANGNLAARGCENRGFEVSYDTVTGAVNGSWKGIPGDGGFRVFQGARQIGGDLPASTLSFTDAAPPPGGIGVTYQLRVLVGGAVETECSSLPVRTFTCASGLVSTVDQDAKKVTLSWTKPVNVNATGLVIRRNGVVAASPGLSESSYVDATGPGVFEYELSIEPGPGADPAQCSTPLSTRAIVYGDFCFYDGFDGHANDAALEGAGWRKVEVGPPVEDASWTVANPGGRLNPPAFDGRPTSGKFIISDSDNASGANPTGSNMSHDLWSPVIAACAGKQAVWLHMDLNAQMNNNGVCAFDVDVTTDDARTWTNVFRRVAPARLSNEPIVDNENADGFYGRLDLDLTLQVGGKPSFRFRLRHFEPNDDWWMAVDNVVVNDQPAAGGKTVVLARESFTDGIPDEWSVESRIGGPANWSTEDVCTRSMIKVGGQFPDGFDGRGLHHLDEYFAMLDSSCAGVNQDELLGTPILDCSGVMAVYLHVKSDVLVSDSAVKEVLLSLDGGDSYEKVPIFSYNGGGLYDSEEDPFYNELILPVPRAAGKPRVVFAFHYQAAAGQGGWWGIDDVSVTGDSLVTRPVFHRADGNGDGSLDLSDAVYILGYLFLGNPAPACMETADSNEDGQVDLSDPIGILNYLFLGNAAPASPGPPGSPCGPDPDGSPKDLGCESYTRC